MPAKKHDPVNHPAHYTFGKIEVIDVLEDWDMAMHEGTALKYIARAPHKGTHSQDLEKAVFYLNRKIKLLKKNGR